MRLQLAILGWLAIYVPVLLLFGVTLLTEDEVATLDGGVERSSRTTELDLPALATTLALAPAAAALAWWWAGRWLRRLEQAAGVQRRLIEDASHELRTPLAVLSANADVLLGHPEPTVELYREGLERSKAAASRLQTTVDALLLDARGRARAIDRRPADLVQIARRVVAGASGDASLTGPARAACNVDAAMVERALANLVANALLHGGGTAELDIAQTADATTVTVTDHGPGIRAADRERIFERFWRGETGSTGLGLPIARQIAEAHGGSLTLDASRRGCAFKLTIPRGSDAPRARSRPS